MIRRATYCALFGLGLLLVEGVAEAQDMKGVARPQPTETWLRDSRYTNGEGYETERYKLNPGIAGSIGYDSNLFLRSGSTTPSEPVTDAFVLSLTPFLSVNPRTTPTPPSYAFSASLAATYFEYLKGFNTAPGDDPTKFRNVGISAATKLAISPGRRWSGDIFAALGRSIQPSSLGDPSATFNRTVPSAGAGVQWAPGGGLFTWKFQYGVTYSYFEAERFHSLNSFNHQLSTTGSWRFLPRTSLFSQSTYTLIRYTSGTTTQADGDAVSTLVGVNGLVTNGFGFLASAGWASTFFNDKGGQQDFDSFIAQAEARFYLSAPPKSESPGNYPSAFVLGYVRDWTQSFIGNFYQRDRGYASLSYFFNGKVLANATAGVSRIHFPPTAFESGAPRDAAYDNLAVDAGAFFEYRVTPHLGLNASAQYTQMISDKRLRTNVTDPNEVDDQKWTRLQASIGARYLF